MNNVDVFDDLWQVICQRSTELSDKKSYTRYLLSHEKGIDKVLEKVGEESCEFILAVKNGNEESIVNETADLMFHVMVALKAANVDFYKVKEELKLRRSYQHLHD